MKEFFKKLKELREKSPYTQQQMADKLGISIKGYQNYEVKTIPPHKKLLKLNKILNFDFSKILYQENVPNTNTEKTLKEYPENDTYSMLEEDGEPIKNTYKEKYLTALEEIRELQKKLLKKNEGNGDDTNNLKRAK